MADCTDPSEQKLSGAFPAKNNATTSNGLQINECAITNPPFDINVFLTAAQTYNKLNEAVNRMIGAEVVWFRAVPQQRSKDVIFQEYTLSNVSDTPVCIKVMLPDGNFPDSRYNYDLMGLEYEVPLEIQIDKHYWETVAGVGTAPQKKDIVYFRIPNKLYQVESAYLFRGFMEQETAWKLNLRKYSYESSRREGEVIKETIDMYTTGTEEIFGDMINQDINKITNDRQNSPYNSTEKDKYKILDPALQIITSKLDIYGVRVAESYYDMNTSESLYAVNYPANDAISSSEDRCLSMWMRPLENTNKEYNVTSIVPTSIITDANFIITTNGFNFKEGDVVSIYRQGSMNLYATYVRTDIDGHQIYVEPKVLEFLTSIKSDWYNLKSFKLKLDYPKNLISGYTSEEVSTLSLNVYADQFIKFDFAGQSHTAILPERLVVNDWHGFILNIGNSWNQFNLYVWKQSENDEANKLSNLHYETMSVTSAETDINTYRILKSNSNITNVRLYCSNLEEEKQSNELLSYFVKDGDKSIIGDNVDPLYKSPYIAKQR